MLRGTGLVVVGWVGRLSVAEVRFLEIQVILVSFAMWVSFDCSQLLFSFSCSLSTFPLCYCCLLSCCTMFHYLSTHSLIFPLHQHTHHTAPSLSLLSIILSTLRLFRALIMHFTIHTNPQPVPYSLYRVFPSLLVSCSFSILTLPHSLSRTFFPSSLG